MAASRRARSARPRDRHAGALAACRALWPARAVLGRSWPRSSRCSSAAVLGPWALALAVVLRRRGRRRRARVFGFVKRVDAADAARLADRAFGLAGPPGHRARVGGARRAHRARGRRWWPTPTARVEAVQLRQVDRRILPREIALAARARGHRGRAGARAAGADAARRPAGFLAVRPEGGGARARRRRSTLEDRAQAAHEGRAAEARGVRGARLGSRRARRAPRPPPATCPRSSRTRRSRTSGRTSTAS